MCSASRCSGCSRSVSHRSHHRRWQSVSQTLVKLWQMDVMMIDWMARELTGNPDIAVVTVTHDR